MGGVKELRGRIKSVGNIKQITRAMEMVATTKLRRFQDKAVGSRPYTEEITSLMAHLAAVLGPEAENRPLFREGTGAGTLVLLVSSDRGLCGAYNTNVFKALEAWMDTQDHGAVRFLAYGKKGFQHLNKLGYAIEHYFSDPPLESIDYRGAARVARYLAESFAGGKCKEVRILYTAFQSMVRYTPTWVDFLPVRASALSTGGEATATGDVILEPDAATIFDELVPRYLETRVYNALIEALTSEYASRRVSMKNATDAAGDMQKSLKSVYNRRRQEGITKDLLDIVGGAEALR
jgi:F-type H+-transporting ATPase subunit gamma